jgi:hypothetical protein
VGSAAGTEADNPPLLTSLPCAAASYSSIRIRIGTHNPPRFDRGRLRCGDTACRGHMGRSRGPYRAALLIVLLASVGCAQLPQPAAGGASDGRAVSGTIEIIEVRTQLQDVEPAWPALDADANDPREQVEVLTIRWTAVADAGHYLLRVDGDPVALSSETEERLERSSDFPPGGALTVEAVQLPDPDARGMYDLSAVTLITGPTPRVELPNYLVDSPPRLPAGDPDTDGAMLDLTDPDVAACQLAARILMAAETNGLFSDEAAVTILFAGETLREVVDAIRDPELQTATRELLRVVDTSDEDSVTPIGPPAIEAAEVMTRQSRCIDSIEPR